MAFLAALAKTYPVQVRFIEMMPIGEGKDFPPIDSGQIRETLEQAFGPLFPVSHQAGQGPAEVFTRPDFAGSIGFIQAVQHGFCSTCNRIRVTAEGKIKLCLHHPVNGDVRELIRAGKTPEELCRWLTRLVQAKPADGYHTDESRPMWKIGG